MAARRFLPAVSALVLATILPSQGWAGRLTEIQIYDPTGHVHTQLNARVIVRSSARAFRGVGGSGAWLYFAFRKTGDAKFRALIRALSHRGEILHRQQYPAFAVDGHVYSRGRIDYKEFPNGLAGNSGVRAARSEPDVGEAACQLDPRGLKPSIGDFCASVQSKAA